MTEQVQFIAGGQHQDARGTLIFCNDFDLQGIRRFYQIAHHDTTTQRGWRAHRIERRWFSVCQGAFLIKLIKITDWQQPDPASPQLSFLLSADQPGVLQVPKGYASCLQATSAPAKVLVFADSPIEKAADDDYLFPLDYFKP